MFIVAITGGIATGKSLVSGVFERNGIPVIDADKIARQIVSPGKPCWYKIREIFGDDILLPTKEINRQKLADVIFNNSEMKNKLNEITHPVIHRTIYKELFKHFVAFERWVILDVPLLFETGILMDFISKIITVTCDPDLQLQRLMARNEFSEENARKRIASQMPLDEKCEKSHLVIDNNGTKDETIEEATRIVRMLNESYRKRYSRLGLIALIIVALIVMFYLVYPTTRKSDAN